MSDFELKDRERFTPRQIAEMVAREEARRRGLKGAEAAAVVPLSDETIRNYMRAGVITPAETTPSGRYLFDRSAVKAVIANRKTPTHGGRRRGAGRKAAKPPPADPAFRAAADARAAINAVHAHADAGTHPRNALTIDDVVRFTGEQLDAVFTHFGADQAGLTQAALDRKNTIFSLRERQRKFDVEAGKLVDADEMLGKWTETLRGIGATLDGIPARFVDRILPMVYPSREIADSLIRSLKDAGVAPAQLDRVREAFSVPPELANLLRAAMVDEMRGVRQLVVERHGSTGNTKA